MRVELPAVAVAVVSAAAASAVGATPAPTPAQAATGTVAISTTTVVGAVPQATRGAAVSVRLRIAARGALPPDRLAARALLTATAERVALRHGLRLVRVNRLGIADLRPMAMANSEPLPELARKLTLDPDVEWAEVARRGSWLLQGSNDPLPDDPRFADAWHLENSGQEGGVPGADVNARAAWALTTGATDIVVALLDSGVELEHDDLFGAMWRNPGEVENGQDDDGNGFVDDLWGWDFANGNNDPRPTESAHGTETAGVIGARTANGLGVAGIAGGWGGHGGVRVMAVQIGERSPLGEALDDGILYAVDNGAQIISLSLSVSPSQAIDLAVAEARRAGVLLVAAAGNSGGKVAYPASLGDAVAISGTTRQDTLWRSSAHGAEIALAAPAQEIVTTNLYDRYLVSSGTSFAAPLVAGAAGLVAAASAEAPLRDDLLLALALGARDLGPVGRDPSFGWGRIDARAAIGARNGVIAHVTGRVELEPLPPGRVATLRAEWLEQGFAVTVDPEDGSYSLPVAGDRTVTVALQAWGMAADSTTLEVAPGGVARVDLQPRPLPSVTLYGRTVAADGAGGFSGVPAAVRILPAAAHAETHSGADGGFAVAELPLDSLVVLEARTVLRQALPESVLVAGPTGADTLRLELLPVRDLDASDGGLREEGGLWEHGVGFTAHTPPAVWGAPLAGGYPNNADASLFSPPIRVDADAPAPQLAFYQQLASEEGYDGGNLQITTDDGATWSVIEPVGGYSLAAFPSGNHALAGEPGWSGRRDWERVIFPLDAVRGELVAFRWQFGSDNDIGGEGWWLDDLMLLGGAHPALDLELAPAALSGIKPGDAVQIELRLNNRWDRASDTLVRWSLDGAPLAERSFGNLDPGATLELPLQRRLPGLAPGSHTLSAEWLQDGRAFDAAGLLLEVVR